MATGLVASTALAQAERRLTRQSATRVTVQVGPPDVWLGDDSISAEEVAAAVSQRLPDADVEAVLLPENNAETWHALIRPGSDSSVRVRLSSPAAEEIITFDVPESGQRDGSEFARALALHVVEAMERFYEAHAPRFADPPPAVDAEEEPAPPADEAAEPTPPPEPMAPDEHGSSWGVGVALGPVVWVPTSRASAYLEVAASYRLGLLELSATVGWAYRLREERQELALDLSPVSFGLRAALSAPVGPVRLTVGGGPAARLVIASPTGRESRLVGSPFVNWGLGWRIGLEYAAAPICIGLEVGANHYFSYEEFVLDGDLLPGLGHTDLLFLLAGGLVF